MRVDLLTEANELESLAPAWWDLWLRTPDATPFSSPAWLLPWWSAFRPGRLLGATLRAADGRLAALLPFYVEDGALGRRLLPLGIGVSDYLDVLIAPETDETALGPATAMLAEAGGHTRWELEQLMAGASAWRLPVPSGFAEEVCDQEVCPVLVLPEGDGLCGVPARQRRKLRMAQHRTARRGGIVRPVAAAEMPRFLVDLARLHGARWRDRGEPGVLAAEQVRAFHALALPALAEAGLADVRTVAIEGDVIGAYYGLRRPGRAYAYLGGFDPDYAFESPGSVLLGQAIAEAGFRGDREFHLLRGREAYKYAWGAIDRTNRRRSLSRIADA